LKLIKDSFANAIKNILRNKLVNFLCLGIIAFTLLIFALFNYVSYSLDNFTQNFTKNVVAIFYFTELDSSERQNRDILKRRENLILELRENALIKSVKFTDKDQAEKMFLDEFPEFKSSFKEFKQKSPLPASIEVVFKERSKLDKKVETLIDETGEMDIIESKQVNLDWAKKVLNIKTIISLVGYFFSSILIFVSFFIIYNIIRLNILYRKDEINIYRLVGATDTYIKTPFIIEGGLLGFFGSLLASFLLFILLKIFAYFTASIEEIFKGILNFNQIPLNIFLIIILLGTAIGIISSYLSLRSFIKPD